MKLTQRRILILSVFWICLVGTAAEQERRSARAVDRPSAPGPLRIHPENSRYFADDSGRLVYLTGSHTWWNLQDVGPSFPPKAFDFDAHLDLLEGRNHNFIRLWRWEQSKSYLDTNATLQYWAPHPWARTGPGLALDGRPRFDLHRFDPDYFDRLRARVKAAGDHGFYVAIMLFQGGRILMTRDPWAWKGHPMHAQNNINGIDGDANGDGRGFETLTLQQPEVTAIQESYIRMVIDTVNDLDNVVYEISNESWKQPAGWKWQYHMIEFIKRYESSLPQQHLVGMTALRDSDARTDRILFDSPADWISPGGSRPWRDPPPATGAKPVILDTDHIWGVGGHPIWVWKVFTRGYNPIYMDPFDREFFEKYTPSNQDDIRTAMGHTRRYAERIGLASMVPRPNVTSTGYVLANPPTEYLIYQPRKGKFTVELETGTYRYEWFQPDQGKVVAQGLVQVKQANHLFQPPFAADAILYLRKVPN